MLTFLQAQGIGRAMLPVMPSYVGWDYRQEAVNRPDGNPDYMFLHGRRGNGLLDLNGERMRIREGECAVVFPGIPCAYKTEGGEWLVTLIGIAGAVCPALLDCLGIHESGVYSIEDQQLLESHAARILSLSEQGEASKPACSAACYRFLLDFAAHMHLQPVPLDGDLPGDGGSYAYRAIRYMENHLTEPFSLDELSAYIGLNSEYLCSVFKKETGITIINYLQRLRIGRARMLLERFPDRSAAKIGTECGYASPSYFGLQFKRITGYTPDAYRKHAAAIRIQ